MNRAGSAENSLLSVALDFLQGCGAVSSDPSALIGPETEPNTFMSS